MLSHSPLVLNVYIFPIFGHVLDRTCAAIFLDYTHLTCVERKRLLVDLDFVMDFVEWVQLVKKIWNKPIRAGKFYQLILPFCLLNNSNAININTQHHYYIPPPPYSHQNTNTHHQFGWPIALTVLSQKKLGFAIFLT